MKSVVLDESLFHGAISLERGDGWVKPWRLPHAQVSLFSPGSDLAKPAEQASGVRLRLTTDSPRITLRVVPMACNRKFDLTIDDELVQTAPLPTDQDTVTIDLAGRGLSPDKPVEIWLPHDQPVALAEMLVEDGCHVSPAPDSRPRWITYGSSISHCRAAHSPARTWPATAARQRHLNLTNLGYGGQCHLDPLIALMIRDMPADFISLKVGINVMGGSSLSKRMFRPAIIGFVRIIREKHPQTPIALISPIISPPRETTPNLVGQSLTLMREQVQDAAARLQAAGDNNLHYFDGLGLFGADLVEKYLPDNLHPNGDGYEVLGNNFAKTVLSRFF